MVTKIVDLDEVATTVLFSDIIGVSQQAISAYQSKGIISRGGTIGDWIKERDEHLRNIAGARGGEQQENLAEARAEDARAACALKRLAYHKEIKTLVPAHDAETALNNWADYSAREIENTIETIVAMIEEDHGIKVDEEVVSDATNAIRRRIIDYAGTLADELVSDS